MSRDAEPRLAWREAYAEAQRRVRALQVRELARCGLGYTATMNQAYRDVLIGKVAKGLMASGRVGQ